MLCTLGPDDLRKSVGTHMAKEWVTLVARIAQNANVSLGPVVGYCTPQLPVVAPCIITLNLLLQSCM